MNGKRVFMFAFLFLCAWVLAPPGVVAQEESAAFDLKASTDYHLNQDGRPTPSYDFLVPLYADDESVLFFSPRYHIDDQTNTSTAEEWNLGLGYRRMILDDRAILGANVYYDWRRSMTGNEFEQAGVGLEFMTEDFTARANGYLSLSEPAELARWRERVFYFAPRSLNYNEYEYTTWEVPTSGIDGEVGFKVPYVSDYCETWVYGGGYYFTDDLTPGSDGIANEDMAGVKARVEVKPTDYVKASFEVRDDNVRGTDYYGQVQVELPFSIENLVAGKNPFEGLKDRAKEPAYEVALADRMYDKVERDPDIITGYAAGTPDQVIKEGVWTNLTYVTAGTITGGSGSWGDPYVTLGHAITNSVAGDVLFVKSGTYSESPTIVPAKSNLTIWGQGYKPPGVTAMPHGLGVVYPTITGALTIDAANVEVMGLKFTNTAGTPALSITGNGDFARVHHNEFRPGAYTGVKITDADGVLIDGNKFYITAGTTTGSTDSFGVWIAGSSTPILGASITNNTFSVTRTGSNPWGSSPDPGIAAIYADVTGTYGNTTSPLSITGNTITVSDTTTSTTNYAPSVRGINLNATGTMNDLHTLIAGNTLKVTSMSPTTVSWYVVEGIHAFADGALYVSITGNNLSGGVSGKNHAIGICLGESQDFSDNTYRIKGEVSYNKLKVANTDTTDAFGNNRAYGINANIGNNNEYIQLDIIKNDLSLGVTARSAAFGIRLWGGNNLSRYGIIDNVLKVSSVTDDAYGVYGSGAWSGAAINADIIGNNLSAGVSTAGTEAGDFAYGIYLVCNGDSGTGGGISSSIGNNLLKVSASGGAAYGILEHAGAHGDGNLVTVVYGNNMATGGVTGKTEACGVYLASYNSADLDVIGNSLKVSSTWTGDIAGGGYAYGIRALADEDVSGSGILTGSIVSNTMSLGILSKHETYGIRFESGFDLGTSGDPFIISNNALKVTSSAGKAYGIYGTAASDLIAGVYGNKLSTGGVTGKTDACGLYIGGNSILGWFNDNDFSAGVTGGSATGLSLDTVGYIGLDGVTADPVEVCGNKIKTTANGPEGNDAYGIAISAGDTVFAEIAGNDLSYGILSKDVAVGIYVEGDAGIGIYDDTVGSTYIVDPLVIADNRLKVTSTYIGTNTDHGRAYGIYTLSSNGDILADIHGNNMSYGVSGRYLTAGILACANAGNLGAYFDYHTIHNWKTDYLQIKENVLKVTSSRGSADGIALFADGLYTNSDGFVWGTLLANDLSAGVTGYSRAYGVLIGLNPFDYTAISERVNFSAWDSIMKVTATYTGTDTGADGVAAGIYALADYQRVSGGIGRNNLSAGISGKWEAYGINLLASGSAIIYNSFMYRNSLKVTSASGIAEGISVRSNGSGTIDYADISENNLSAGISGLTNAVGIYAYSNNYISALGIDYNSLKVTSAGGKAYGIYAEAGPYLYNSSVTRNNMLAGVSGKYDAAGIYLSADGNIYGITTISPLDVSENQLKVTSTNTIFAAGTAGYLVSGIHLAAGGYIHANVLTNTATVTGAGSTLPTADTDGVWGVSLVSTADDVGLYSGGTFYNSTIAGNSLTVTNGRNTLDTTGADGIHLSAVGASGDVYADCLNNYLKVKAYKDAAGAWVSAGVNIGDPTKPFTFTRNRGTVNGTLTTAAAERWLLYLAAGTGGNVDWRYNYVTPVTGTWTGDYPTSSVGPVEADPYTGTITP